jgi:hypothetical protein
VSPEARVERVHCNRCLQETNHKVLFSHERSEEDEIDGEPVGITFTDSYSLLECLGCGDLTFRWKQTSSAFEGEQTALFPPRTSRSIPKWELQLPLEIQELLREVYNALHVDGRRLAMMGARTIVERTMILKTGNDLGTFEKNLCDFQDAGFLSKRNREFLQTALEVGHAAAHRAHSAEPDVINTVMDIIENLLQAVFVLGDEAQRIRTRIPSRPRGLRVSDF